jgi:D-alanine-D-alanine ligase
VLIETWLPGLEFTVAVIGNGEEARCLPIVGMNFDVLPGGTADLRYEAKWLWDTVANRCSCSSARHRCRTS